jgi:hypothetical protein
MTLFANFEAKRARNGMKTIFFRESDIVHSSDLTHQGVKNRFTLLYILLSYCRSSKNMSIERSAECLGPC